MNIVLTIAKKFWREILIVILVIICSASFRQCSVNKDSARLGWNATDSAFNVAHYYNNKLGQVVGQVKTHELTIKELQKYGKKMGFENEKLKKQVGNSNRLIAHWKGKAESRGSSIVALTDTTVNTLDGTMDLNEGFDTVEAKAFNWSNKYLTLDGIIHLDSNKLALSYIYRVDFELTAYYKRQGLFKKPQLVSDIYFSDPNMRVQEFKGFVVKEPRKKLYQTGLFKVSIAIGSGFLLGKTL